MQAYRGSFLNKVDKKGRVSVPATFRALLAQEPGGLVFSIASVRHPALEIGGSAKLAQIEARLASLDPFSDAYDDLSLVYHGDSAELALDPEGRLTLSGAVRAHTGITDQAIFVGRGTYFELWDPQSHAERREVARRRVRDWQSRSTPENGDPS